MDPIVIGRIDRYLSLIRSELDRAVAKFAPFNSAHEGYAVLLEEVDELWDEVKASDYRKMKGEAVQVAAMAIRFLVDLDHKFNAKE